MDSLSEMYERALALAGAVLVLAALFLLEAPTAQLLVVLLGVFLVGTGGWGTIPPLQGDRRRYGRLREETEILLDQVRALDELLVAEEPTAVARQRERLHDQVERVVDVAGAET